ncbi:polyribonucleotide nucleotidyltransferase [Striga asiatica]|uniref:Polyribonucleotide nucleotidyltransferase n=1 Tax=Striga asiatica TaxID=4170 RepID=A0A5A7PC13_STRAF|nr:polyribonucleotide nucleotidyltransferase [Striga asiatica]
MFVRVFGPASSMALERITANNLTEKEEKKNKRKERTESSKNLRELAFATTAQIASTHYHPSKARTPSYIPVSSNLLTSNGKLLNNPFFTFVSLFCLPLSEFSSMTAVSSL